MANLTREQVLQTIESARARDEKPQLVGVGLQICFIIEICRVTDAELKLLETRNL